MNRTEFDTISLVVLDSQAAEAPAPDQRHAMLSAFHRVSTKSVEVGIDTLSASISAIVERLGRIVDALPENCGHYTIDELTFSLNVNGNGKVSLIAEVGAGFTSSICIKLKRTTTQP